MRCPLIVIVSLASCTLTACNPDDGIPAGELCAAIEARSDCASNECIIVACYDSAPQSPGSSNPLHCALNIDHAPFVYVQAEARAVAETEEDCAGSSFYHDVECAPADTGAVPADMLVGCIDLE